MLRCCLLKEHFKKAIRRRPPLPAFLLLLLPLFTFSQSYPAYAQQHLSLQDAVTKAVNNYGTVKAKSYYASASKAQVVQAQRDYLPNLNLSAQQTYGTVNGQNGPAYGFGGLGVSSSGLPLAEQNWNAAFGALYLVNVNWDFFAFGRAKEKVKAAEMAALRDEKDWQQEIFKHKVRTATAYLNLLAAKQLYQSYEKNLERAATFRRIVAVRAKNGLVAGVDSSQADAELSSATIALNKAKDFELEQSNQLSQLMGIPAQDFALDTVMIAKVPGLVVPNDSAATPSHPVLLWYQSRIAVSREQAKYFKTFYYPTFTLVGIMQSRGSGFGSGYAANQNDFTKDYWTGIKPVRSNYLAGIGVTWNLAQPLRISQQVKSQEFISKGLQEEYELANQQINAQLQLSESKLQIALKNYQEAPVQVQAASNAYNQKSVLYRNGLTNLVDVTQALYVLIRAETDRDIANANVWQALLLKAAAAGDFSLFENQL